MTRDEVMEAIHNYAIWSRTTDAAGCMSIGPSTLQEYRHQFTRGVIDLLRGDGLIPGAEIPAETYWRYHSMNLWPEKDLLRNPDPHIRRDIEYDVARRKGRKAIDRWHEKWAEMLPGDVA